ncbi:MAG TPA: 23S rRNA (adenine(2503)-C(2))-methyltransferase RlmN [Sedimentisphaerales bacterium]|nr:23S rRNA (adenine(2503)-C(2))-methyltransferase RlmN [Sedimentisphaerales bacterium]
MAQDLKDRTLGELEHLVLELGQRKYLAGYIFSFIHRRGITDISQISPLSKEFRRRLAEQGCYISRPGKVQTLEDPDGTIKYLFELENGNRIEAVLLSDDDRKTVCISTQAGCAMNCGFCATGRLRLRRNLSAAEIVDQVGRIRRDKHRIGSVVYMGMGEPLENYDAVVRSANILNHPDGYNIGIRHITISTCGIPPAIERLAGENIHPRLAVSLNAPANPLRTKLMPINKKYPIESVLRAVKAYQLKTKRRVTFEYVLIKGFNDSTTQARLVAKLVAGVRCNINLIEFNPHPGCQFAASDKKVIGRFAETLRAAGIETTVRYKKGRKIKAACGQLGADLLGSGR